MNGMLGQTSITFNIGIVYHTDEALAITKIVSGILKVQYLSVN